MSIEMTGQMYIVIVKHDSPNGELVKTVIGPNSTTSQSFIPTGYGKPSFAWRDSDYLIPANERGSFHLK